MYTCGGGNKCNFFFFSKDCSKVLNSGVLSKLGGYFEIKSQR